MSSSYKRARNTCACHDESLTTTRDKRWPLPYNMGFYFTSLVTFYEGYLSSHFVFLFVGDLYLKGLSSEICLAGNGINRQISLKRTGAEIISCFSPSTLKWEALYVSAPPHTGLWNCRDNCHGGVNIRSAIWTRSAYSHWKVRRKNVQNFIAPLGMLNKRCVSAIGNNRMGLKKGRYNKFVP